MNNKKRAFMVPVMTLAVCAIAMVGLGFAITTSVTSDENAVEKLMIDLNDSKTAWNAVGNTPAASEPLNDPVNGLLKIGFSTEKSSKTVNATYNSDSNYTFTADIDNVTITTTFTSDGGSGYTAKIKVGGNGTEQTAVVNGTTASYTKENINYTTVADLSGTTPKATTTKTVIDRTVSDGFTYAKIFGNKTNVTMKVEIDGMDSGQSGNKLTSITLTAYKSTGFGGNSPTVVGTVTVGSTASEATSFSGTFGCTDVYVIAITGLTVNGKAVTIDYSESGNAITGTWNGFTGTPNGSVSLGFTFTAEA